MPNSSYEQLVRLEAGDVLYRQGDESDAVYFIQDGAIEILRSQHGKESVLRTLGAGEVLGEMGILRDAPRSTTARASVDTQLTRMAKDNFFAALRNANAIALPLMRMLCERLDNMNRRRMELQPYGSGVAVKDVSSICLRPATNALARAVGQEAVPVSRLPFTVAAAGEPNEAQMDSRGLTVDLTQVPGAEHMARDCHFTVAKTKNRLVVQDFGAPAGTYINDELIDRFHHAGTAGLERGKTPLRIGPESSAVQFIVEIS